MNKFLDRLLDWLEVRWHQYLVMVGWLVFCIIIVYLGWTG